MRRHIKNQSEQYGWVVPPDLIFIPRKTFPQNGIAIYGCNSVQYKLRQMQSCSYRYYLKDRDIDEDYELTNFTTQLSADGSGADSGIGMVRYACNNRCNYLSCFL